MEPTGTHRSKPRFSAGMFQGSGVRVVRVFGFDIGPIPRVKVRFEQQLISQSRGLQ